jgi:uncharacterized membrane protein
MTQSPRPRPPALHPVSFARALRARPRLLGCAALGVVAYLLGRQFLDMSIAALTLVAWNAGALLYLVLAWEAMARSDVQGIRKRAISEDEGRIAILLLVVLAALAVLLAVGSQLAQVKSLQGGARTFHLSLAALTVLTSWLFTQVLFALHYAHEFYAARVHGAMDPLLFPGTADPTYGDFFYFSCVIGSAAQTADVSFNGSALRPAGTLHCVLAFFFNATLLALSINLAAGLLL